MGKITVELQQEDLGTLIICATRYCYGRKTYISSLIIGIVIPLLPKLSDKDIFVLSKDFKEQEKFDNFGDKSIDKPFWMKFGQAIEFEKEKREENK